MYKNIISPEHFDKNTKELFIKKVENTIKALNEELKKGRVSINLNGALDSLRDPKVWYEINKLVQKAGWKSIEVDNDDVAKILRKKKK